MNVKGRKKRELTCMYLVGDRRFQTTQPLDLLANKRTVQRYPAVLSFRSLKGFRGNWDIFGKLILVDGQGRSLSRPQGRKGSPVEYRTIDSRRNFLLFVVQIFTWFGWPASSMNLLFDEVVLEQQNFLHYLIFRMERARNRILGLLTWRTSL
ncbi:hypothetical protein SDJN03_13555, partial [Cucurbita argyrosperma subsp. sororia]